VGQFPEAIVAASYQVTCQCGAAQNVNLTQAGSTIVCRCGCNVEVPSLVRLKSAAGEESVSPDFEIEHLLQANALPLEKDCLICHRTTQHVFHVQVDCERAINKSSRSRSEGCAFVLVGGLWGYFLYRTLMRDQSQIQHGRDLLFKLPLRICERCASDVQTSEEARLAMMESSLFRRLLEKFPNAKITLCRD
jgi:hypothetical protein